MSTPMMLVPATPKKVPFTTRVNRAVARAVARAVRLAVAWAALSLFDAACRYPRVTLGVYAVGWGWFGVPLWIDGAGWWNAAVVAVNPLTLFAVLAAVKWREWDAPEPDPIDDDVTLWQTVLASDHVAHQ